MTDLNRYIRHPASTSTGAASWLHRNRPLGAGRHQAILGSNARHLARVNSVRPLCSHPGVRGFYQPARSGVTTPPRIWDLNWTLTPKSGGVAIDLGVHWVWRAGGDVRFPVLSCSFSAALEDAGDTVGVYLGVAPGERFIADDPGSFDNWSHSGTTTFTDKVLQVPLGESSIERRPVAMVGGTSTADPLESGELLVFRAFLGGFNSSNTNMVGRLAHILGISLFLEPPA